MEYALPTPADHCRVQILVFYLIFWSRNFCDLNLQVKPIGQFPSAIFDRLLKKLENKLCGVEGF